MIDWMKEIDRDLFLWLNGLHHPWLDPVMYFMSSEFFWIPLYIVLLWLIAKTYNPAVMFWTLLGIAVVVTIGDRMSVELFKNVFQRYRPSRNLEIGSLVHIVNDYRGGLYGFVSSHATNFFGIATFVFLLLKRAFPRGAYLLLMWAALVAYTRIYLGVHYPADIFVGGLLGAGVGSGVFFMFKRYVLPKS